MVMKFYITYNLYEHPKVKQLIRENFCNSRRTKCYVYFQDKKNNYFHIEKIKPLLEWYKRFRIIASDGKDPNAWTCKDLIVIDTEEKLNLIPDGDNNNNNIGDKNELED
jgi:hypothetical protein